MKWEKTKAQLAVIAAQAAMKAMDVAVTHRRIQEAERVEQEDAIQYTEDEEREYRRVMDGFERQGFGFNPAEWEL